MNMLRWHEFRGKVCCGRGTKGMDVVKEEKVVVVFYQELYKPFQCIYFTHIMQSLHSMKLYLYEDFFQIIPRLCVFIHIFITCLSRHSQPKFLKKKTFSSTL